MSRDAGFERMDVSTAIASDPKFRLLARSHPELLSAAFMVYVGGVLGDSWREGERLTVDEAWPLLLPFDEAVVAALIAVGLLDAERRVSAKAWESWFGSAFDRRRLGRERQRRADEKRGRVRPSAQPVSQGSQSGRQAGPALEPPLDVRRTNGHDRDDSFVDAPKLGDAKAKLAAHGLTAFRGQLRASSKELEGVVE